ncbi:DnaJ domain protein [Ceratobasidium sp. AG-Ba]|nr:DnaJ domain protein [Ceratobasidium sp. AG-Ba]
MDWLTQLGPYQGFAYRTLAWWFLPGLATRGVLSLYYQALLVVGLSHWIPPNDSPRRPKHHQRAFALVVLSYLVYTLVLDILEQPPSFYSLLGVDYQASEAEIKNAYKAFARRNHPDRVGPAGAPLFIQVRDAYEALKHPIKRYGYDRFGFDALGWKVAENPHAMLYQGLENALYYYVPTGVIMLAMTVFGWGGHSAYWRSVSWALIAATETCIIIGCNPFSALFNPFASVLDLFAPALAILNSGFSYLSTLLVPSVDASTIPAMAPYQWVFFLRQVFVTSAIAIGQILPVLSPPPPTAREERTREAEIAKLAIALDPVVRQIIVHSHISNQETQENFLKELQYLDPAGPPSIPTFELSQAHRQALEELRPTLQRLVVQNVLLKDPDLRPSYVSAVERSKRRVQQVALAGIGREELTPAPEDMDMAARLLAIPSPPSSVFSLSREPTPEFKPLATNVPFDTTTPGFNYQPSPARSSRPSPSRANFPPVAPGMHRRPSLSPSKRSSISLNTVAGRSVSEGIPFSPTSPVMVKQELS